MRVLAVDPCTDGIGFAVLEGPERLIDWGVKQVAADDKNAQSVGIIEDLIERYRPHALVLEDPNAKESRRSERVRELLDAIRQAAKDKRIKVLDVTPDRVRQAFAPTKDNVAASIAGLFPELGPQLPRPRKCGDSEAYAMPVFDAAAFAQTFFHFKKRKQAAEDRQAVREALR